MFRIENPHKIEDTRDIISTIAAGLPPPILRDPVKRAQSMGYLGRIVQKAKNESPESPFDTLLSWSQGEDRRAKNLHRRGITPENILIAELLFREQSNS